MMMKFATVKLYFASDDDDHDIHLEIGRQKSFLCDERDFDAEYTDDMSFHHEIGRQKTMMTMMMMRTMRTMMTMFMMMTMISTLK